MTVNNTFLVISICFKKFGWILIKKMTHDYYFVTLQGFLLSFASFFAYLLSQLFIHMHLIEEKQVIIVNCKNNK